MTQPRWQPAHAPLYDPRDDHDACGVGFLADLDGRHAARMVPMALEALAALEHRGARAADDSTGDGAGLLLPLTRPLLARILAEMRQGGVRPRPGPHHAVGMCFLPGESVAAEVAQHLVADKLRAEGLGVVGWREVPVDASMLAGRPADAAPRFGQIVVAAPRGMRRLALARRLTLARRAIEVAAAATPGLEQLTLASLSDRTIVYKGLFVGDELGRFYDDLRLPDLNPRLVVFHQRYSTNTFPSWRLAQPFRFLAHNGEINTVRANRAAMHGRRNDLGGGAWSRRLAAIGPLTSPDGSDSLSLDEAVELLVLAGRPLDEALVQLVPPADGLTDPSAPDAPAASEPWDGPAALVFADGMRVGCLLDRNGLRPAAVSVTSDGLVVASSEAGSVSLSAGRLERVHRLGPGELVVADIRTGTLQGPIPATLSGTPTRQKEHLTPIPVGPTPMQPPSNPRLRIALGLDAEVVRQVIRPMALDGREAIWSMGDDTPIAPLARRPRRVTAFLRQAFAQVTNPAIDPERERVVMSLAMAVGRQPRLLATEPGAGRTVLLAGPILDADGWARLVRSTPGWPTATLDATWPAARGERGLGAALERLARQARAAMRRGYVLVAISDRAASPGRAAIPPVLAVGRVHQALVAAGHRSRCDVVVDAGEC
ncbi:MAG: glutamate synthase central domain-containing protein, partial [Candidatus Limnocylindria bacterium]